MTELSPTRRRVLGLAGAAGFAATAGCSFLRSGTVLVKGVFVKNAHDESVTVDVRALVEGSVEIRTTISLGTTGDRFYYIESVPDTPLESFELRLRLGDGWRTVALGTNRDANPDSDKCVLATARIHGDRVEPGLMQIPCDSDVNENWPN